MFVCSRARVESVIVELIGKKFWQEFKEDLSISSVSMVN